MLQASACSIFIVLFPSPPLFQVSAPSPVGVRLAFLKAFMLCLISWFALSFGQSAIHCFALLPLSGSFEGERRENIEESC